MKKLYKSSLEKIEYIKSKSETYRNDPYFINACKEGNRHKIDRVYNKVRRIEDDKKLAQGLTPDQWARELKDVTYDRERFDRFGILEFKDAKPMIYNVWNFEKHDSRLGGLPNSSHPQGQVALNTLYYYSKPGDRIVHCYNSEESRRIAENACKIMGRTYVGVPYPKELFKQK